jgi:hypothetical protein
MSTIPELSKDLERLAKIYIEKTKEGNLAADQADFIGKIKPEIFKLQLEKLQGKKANPQLDRCLALYQDLKKILDISAITAEQAKRAGKCAKFIEIACKTAHVAKRVYDYASPYAARFMKWACKDDSVPVGLGVLSIASSYVGILPALFIGGAAFAGMKYRRREAQVDRAVPAEGKEPEVQRAEEKKDAADPSFILGTSNQFNIPFLSPGHPGEFLGQAIAARAVVSMLQGVEVNSPQIVNYILTQGLEDYLEVHRSSLGFDVIHNYNKFFPLGWKEIQQRHPDLSKQVRTIASGADILKPQEEITQLNQMMKWLANKCTTAGQKIGGIFNKYPHSIGIVLQNLGDGKYKIDYFNPQGEEEIPNHPAIKRTFDSIDEFVNFLFLNLEVRCQGVQWQDKYELHAIDVKKD